MQSHSGSPHSGQRRMWPGPSQVVCPDLYCVLPSCFGDGFPRRWAASCCLYQGTWVLKQLAQWAHLVNTTTCPSAWAPEYRPHRTGKEGSCLGHSPIFLFTWYDVLFEVGPALI